ncbi:MAG TPA: hypothetical protein VJ772_06455 [Nitrososphaeraceae archaeon]|nr:hypothetical protein [Nitrososphaeraceae archaeon]
MKPVVTDIQTEKIEQLKALLRSGKYGKWEYTMTSTHRNALIKKYLGGLCLGCENVPTKIVSNDISDSEMKAKRIEHYCQSCYVKLVATNGIDETIALRDKKYQSGA